MSLRLYMDCGPDGKECTRLIREYSYTADKGVHMDHSFRNGIRKKWVCSDRVNCSWEVRMRKKIPCKSDRASKAHSIPFGNWYIFFISDGHDEGCLSKYHVKKEGLKELDGFKGAFTPGVHTSRKRVVSCVSNVHKVDISSQSFSSTIYRAIREKEVEQDKRNVSDFALIPSYLKSLANDNPGTYVSCQLDTESRFLRCVVVYAPLIHYQAGLLIYGIDCCHMSCSSYNGLMMNLVARDGDHANQVVASAFVNTETVDNYCWFFLNCIRAGLDFDNIPLQSDRGHQRGAQVVLEQMGFQVSLKFCVYHIKLNVFEQFKDDDVNLDELENVVVQLQRASNVHAYFSVLETVKNISPNVHDYLLAIHPTSFSVFGNKTFTKEEVDLINSVWGNRYSFGKPLPLHGWSANTAVEGEHNAMNYDDTRTQLPLGALMSTAVRCNFRILRLIKTANDATSANNHIFQPACQFRDHEVEKSGLYVVKETSEKDVFCVTKAGSEGMHEVHYVHVLEHTCSNCVIHQQRGMICRHQLAVIRFLSETSGSKRDDWGEICAISKHFHKAYRTHEAKNLYSLKIPSLSTLIPNLNILPSPTYKQGGRKKGFKKKDKKKVYERIPNNGEIHSSKTSMKPKPQCAKDSDFKNFVDTIFPGTTKKRRPMYKCSKCGKEGHNRSTCTTQQIAFSSRSIIAGEYVVNDCPFKAFGVLHEYIAILDDSGKEIGREEYAVDVENENEYAALTMLVNVGKEGDVACHEQTHEVVNEDCALDELDLHIKELSETKCEVEIDRVKKDEDMAKCDIKKDEDMAKCDIMIDLSEFENEKLTVENKLYVESKEVALPLLAKLNNSNPYRVSIQVNGKHCCHPLVTLQKAVANSSLYDSMIKKLGGRRAKPSQKVSETVLSTIGNIPVTHRDLSRLRNEKWLNDNIINAFATLANNESSDKVHFFASYFIHQYEYSGFPAVKNYMLKNEININNLSFLVFPINASFHWFTAVADMQRKLICLYDSMQPCSDPQELCYLKNSSITFVIDYLTNSMNVQIKEWRFVYESCPQQPNSFDCGVHTCMHLYCLCHDVSMKYDATSTLSLRGYIFHCILSKSFLLL